MKSSDYNIPYKAPSRKLFYIHLVVYLIGMAVLWTHYYSQNVQMHGGAYPWEAWFTGSWFIFLMGHLFNTFFDHNKDNRDKYYVKYLSEREN